MCVMVCAMAGRMPVMMAWPPSMWIERPIRVGDWVVIGNTEGKVRRIAVRATEIETFDSASVIVPNSMFVASPVTNWTLKNRRARIRIGGLGILQVRKRPARMGRNPATGEQIKIKASKKVAFRASKELKEAI